MRRYVLHVLTKAGELTISCGRGTITSPCFTLTLPREGRGIICLLNSMLLKSRHPREPDEARYAALVSRAHSDEARALVDTNSFLDGFELRGGIHRGYLRVLDDPQKKAFSAYKNHYTCPGSGEMRRLLRVTSVTQRNQRLLGPELI
jgi:hypothetical protein